MIDAVKRTVERPGDPSAITDWRDFPGGPIDSEGHLCEDAQRLAIARMRDAIEKNMRVFFAEYKFASQDTIKLTYEMQIAVNSLSPNVLDITETLRHLLES